MVVLVVLTLPHFPVHLELGGLSSASTHSCHFCLPCATWSSVEASSFFPFKFITSLSPEVDVPESIRRDTIPYTTLLYSTSKCCIPNFTPYWMKRLSWLSVPWGRLLPAEMWVFKGLGIPLDSSYSFFRCTSFPLSLVLAISAISFYHVTRYFWPKGNFFSVYIIMTECDAAACTASPRNNPV